MAMNMQPELLSTAGAKREIENNAILNPHGQEFINNAKYNLDRKSKRRLKYTYGIVKGIDSGIENGYIINVEGALRMRDIGLSMSISYMARNGIVDIDILEAEGLTIDEVANEYNNHYQRREFIVKHIQNNDYIQNAITKLAENGKIFISKNSDEISDIEEKLDILEAKLVDASNGGRLLYNNTKNTLEERLQTLKHEDFLNGDFPIEDICLRLVMGGYRNISEGRTIYEGDTFRDTIWYLSKTAQIKLIEFIVKTHKDMNKEEITAYRATKNKANKKEYKQKKCNTKELTADEKRQLVQMGKADGSTQTEVAKQIGCSVRTVKIYWK